jgi:hypothetical protein
LKIGSWKETKTARRKESFDGYRNKAIAKKARADEEAPIATAWELREQSSELGNRNRINSSLDYDVENKLRTNC